MYKLVKYDATGKSLGEILEDYQVIDFYDYDNQPIDSIAGFGMELVTTGLWQRVSVDAQGILSEVLADYTTEPLMYTSVPGRDSFNLSISFTIDKKQAEDILQTLLGKLKGVKYENN